MNFRYVLKNLGNLMYFEALTLIVPIMFAFYYNEVVELFSFAFTS